MIQFAMDALPRIAKTHPERMYKQKQNPRVLLVTNARNETCIYEWVAHHLLLGFDHVHVYDHKSIVPIHSWKHDSRLTVERCHLENPVKLVLMNRAVRMAQQQGFDWMLYLDADEFLCIQAFSNVKSMLAHFFYAHSLSINWVMFGSNFHDKTPSEGLLIEKYTQSNRHVDMHVKTFVRPNEVIQAQNPHFYKIYSSHRMFHISGKIMPKIQIQQVPTLL